MIVISGDSLNEVFSRACSAVLASGERVSPRGLETREVLGAHLCLTDPRRRLLDIPPIRVLNPAFAIAETVWILSGSDDPWIYGFNEVLKNFTDDGILQGAYGPRMRRWHQPGAALVDQLDAVRRQLIADPDTRQAVIQLFDPGRDFCGHRDVPCTLGYRFYLRAGRLHMHTTMRSQNLWLGFGYDVFAATVLQELLAGWLDADIGEYHHHVDSLHLYTPVLEQAASLPASLPDGERVGVPRIAWPGFDQSLRDVLELGLSGSPEDSEPSCAWDEAARVLSSYRHWKAGDSATARRVLGTRAGTMIDALHRWYDRLGARSARQRGDLQPAVAGDAS